MSPTARDDDHVTTTCSQSYGRTLLLDLGDVLFHWSVQTLTALPASTFRAVILTPAWGDLERGKISEDDALKSIGEELALEPDKIRQAIHQCRQTLSVDLDLIAKLQALKQEMRGNLKIYAM
jgi:hypothetical protein